MSKSDPQAERKGLEDQADYERIMKEIAPFISRSKKLKTRPREVWRRGEDVPGDFGDRFRIVHHMATRSGDEE